jgi:glucokinase
MTRQVAIGVDLGGTSTKVGLVDQKGKILAAESFVTVGDKGTQHFIDSVAATMDRLVDRQKFDRSLLIGAGVGSPGPIDLKTGVLLKTANLPWMDFPIRDQLAERLDLAVVLDNDANAAAYGEFWCGGESRCRNMVLLTLGTGVGAGVILDGEVLHGHFDNAGELGHMIVAPNGLVCGCGQRGCLEAYSSASALARRFMHATGSGEKSGLHSGSRIDAKAISDHARRGDKLCHQLWDEACFHLAIASINIQHAYNSELILLGGGMSDAGDFLLDTVRGHFDRSKWRLHNDFPKIELARLGSDAGLIGAAGLAWKCFRAPT